MARRLGVGGLGFRPSVLKHISSPPRSSSSTPIFFSFLSAPLCSSLYTHLSSLFLCLHPQSPPLLPTAARQTHPCPINWAPFTVPAINNSNNQNHKVHNSSHHRRTNSLSIIITSTPSHFNSSNLQFHKHFHQFPIQAQGVPRSTQGSLGLPFTCNASAFPPASLTITTDAPSFIVSISWSTDQTTTAQPDVPQTTAPSRQHQPSLAHTELGSPACDTITAQSASRPHRAPLPPSTSRALSQLRQGLHQSGRMLGVLVWRSLHKGGFGQWFGVVWRSDWILGGGWWLVALWVWVSGIPTSTSCVVN